MNYEIGYCMNQYPLAPFLPTPSAGPWYSNAPWAYRVPANPPVVPVTHRDANGQYFRASQWRRGSERALVFDSVTVDFAVQTSSVPWTAATFLAVPNPLTFVPDFNRHLRRVKKATENDPGINVLFCDGHVDTMSARDTYRAIVFK
jgi:prepilin-type processing-associated H-X9-DG protein